MLLEFICQRLIRVKVHPVIVTVAKVLLGAPTVLNASLMEVPSMYTAVWQGPMRRRTLNHLPSELSRVHDRRFINVLVQELHFFATNLALTVISAGRNDATHDWSVVGIVVDAAH